MTKKQKRVELPKAPKVKKTPALTAKQKELFDELTPLQRSFVTHILCNKKDGPAWEAACRDCGEPIPKNTSQSAIQSMKSTKVKAFLDSVRSQTIEKQVAGAIMAREEGMEILTRLIRAKHPGKLRRITATVDGVDRELTVVDAPDELTDDELEAIEEMYNTPHGVKIKNISKTEALKQLATMENWNKQVEQKNNEIHIHMSELQLKM
jgi:phage terminase small subunit